MAGDAVARGQLGLDEAGAGGALAAEDLFAQRVGDRVNGRRHAATVAGRRRISGAASTISPARMSPTPNGANDSLRTSTPSSVAVSGSASVSVAVSAAESCLRPRAKST